MISALMKAKAIAGILAAALLVFALPASALGAPRHYRQPASVDAEVHLRGTNGFRFFAFTFRDAAVVSGSKQVSKFGEENVNYFARSQRGQSAFKDGVLALNLGKVGRFRGRFVAKSTETRKPDADCTGDPTTIEKGFFVGSFNFHGERGYSSIHAQREHGTVTRQGAQRCTVPTEHPGHEGARSVREEKEAEREAHLLASDSKFRAFFQAYREEPAGLKEAVTTFAASVTGGKAGAFEVSHSAFVFDFSGGAASTFQTPNLAEPLNEATLKPPAPFSGSATFHLETPKTASWTGDLAVELPGLGKVPLTGGSIKAGLCAPGPHCTKTLPERLQPVLEAPSGTAVGIRVEDQSVY
jgi:hypothetical protein